MSSQGSTGTGEINNRDIEAKKLDVQSDGMEKVEMQGGGAPIAEEPVRDGDFPDLAPSKSMEFPEGFHYSNPTKGRWDESMVDGGRRLLLFVLLLW